MKAQPSSDIQFNRTYSIDEFNESIQRFDLIGSLMSLQKLGALMGNQVMANVNIEFEFYASEKKKLKAGTLTKDFIAFLAKQVLLNCGSSDIQYNDVDLFNLIYKYGNLESDLSQMSKEGDAQDKGWLWLIRATNQQWSYLRLHSIIIARYHWIFTKIFEINSELGEKLNQTIGMDVFDAMKIGTCINANYCPREDGSFADSFLMSSYTNTKMSNLKSLLTEENIIKFFDIFAITPEEFKEECNKFVLADPVLKKYEFNPLKRFPVIKTNSSKDVEKFIIPSLSDFLYGCFEGLYYVMLDRLDEQDKSTFWKEIGKIFEQYVGELIGYYDITSLSDANLIPETTYNIGKEEWKSSDWILVSDKYIFQIECKKRKIDNYSRAGIQNLEGAGMDSLIIDLAKQVDKLAQKEEHIKQNKVPGITYQGQEFVNVIVYLDEMFALDRYAKEKVKEKMEQQSDNFYIFGCWEFELACQQSKDKQQDLNKSIQDVVNDSTKIYDIDFLDEIYRDFFKSLYSDIEQ